MSAPDWLVDVVFDSLPLLSYPDETTVVAADIANAAWQAMEDRANAGTLEFTDQIVLEEPRLRTLCGEPRTIPARSTDPVTSHKATEEIKVRAGTQRARLLEAFGWAAAESFLGLTDEEAAIWADGVSVQSEYAKRCSELREAGFIEPTGKTRRGASGMERIVSRITDKGREWVEANSDRSWSADQSEQDWTTGPGMERNV